MNQALRQLPLSTVRLVENDTRLQCELGDLIGGLPVINTRRELVSLAAPTCQTVQVLMDFCQILWVEGKYSICFTVLRYLLSVSFGVSKQSKMILVV